MKVVVIVAVTALGLSLAGCDGGESKSAPAAKTQTTETTEAGATPALRNESVADVVERVLTGVVNVKTIGFDGTEGEASGVVIDRRGVIVTNNHVVQGARTLTISFNDGRHTQPVTGEVIGTAPERDLAIIRVRLDDLIPVLLGRSSKLRLGDSVLAIGFPLGLGGGPTVTQGIVSGLDRTISPDGGAALEGLLQTDAAINPGNSGGALVDSSGRLVGINTAAAQAGSAENVGFAIAIDEARPVIDEIRSKPADQRSWLGVTFDSIDNPAAAVQLGLPPETRGAAVIAVFPGSPASKAGLRAGDVVVSIDGRAVSSTEDMSTALRSLDPGDSVVVEVVDQSGPRRVTVTVGKRPATLPSG
jgi:S1-C subfamily serine protease